MGRLIEGVWDCVFCGTDKIRGSERVCPCCGKTRGQDVKFYMDNPKNYVNEEVAKTMAERDRNDSTRKIAPAVPAPDAIMLDNSETLEKTLETAINIIMEKVK